MYWLILVLAGIFEMLGVVVINMYSNTHQKRYVLLLILTFACSLYFLSVALIAIPMSTAYAIWTGIGAVGGAIVGILFYGESKNVLRLFFMGLILASTIGLKLFH
ncbi:DMT family transporter [Macrococcoides bohemicum]|uniref:QacE family quaternary ammonium compound efflux SMR transporter n=1 Tax=Macrococcoides bohemicum TaxID=1903056 RepID=A0A328A6I9_9STAP|nr:multidrug efflux SMR transporter [Macrococcus bohemicus]QYA44114.1 multidrug efflux SMR transporter [Macrococcus bohemicus]RAK50121.1 QacE family quaternary ammonium compound efflux SMR transporter [Macrococcus bohemicus]